MRKTNAIKARKARARNFGLEADAVRAMDCIVHTAGSDSGLADEELLALPLGWAACGGAACAAHSEPRQRGGVGEGRMRLFPACAVHHAEAGESSPIKGPSSKRIKFEERYGVNVGERADAIALAHPRPLGILGLADRWAWWQVHEHLGTVVELEALDGYLERLVGYDLAALLSWVRRFMDAACLEWGVSKPTAMERENLAYRVSVALALDADGGEPLGVAWVLCQLAGWPS